MEKIRVIAVRVGKPPEVIEMENTLEAKQEFVGGWIEMITPLQHGEDTAVLIGNEEAKLLGMEPNAYLCFEDGRVYDVVCGDFLIVDAPIGSDEFASLSDEQIEKYMVMYG